MNSSLEYVAKLFPKHASLIETFASLHKGVMLVFDDKQQLIGSNAKLLDVLEVDSFESASAVLNYEICLNESTLIDFKDVHKMVKKEGLEMNLHLSSGEVKSFSLAVDCASVEDSSLYIALLEDHSSVQKAIQAHHYFETFKRKFLTSISHEFRTPMNAVLGFVKLLEHEALNQTQHHQIAMIDESATEMMYKIENLLEMMQLESGAITLHETVFKPMIGLDEFFVKFHESAQHKNITLLSFIDPKIPHSMVGDPGKIKRVLESLISNAIKFTAEDGQIYLEIKVLHEEEGFVTLQYSVLDSGEGIAKEKLAHILRPFTSAEENQKLGKHGLGIGLSICHKYLSMMHSKLTVASKLGKGSKFFFTLKHKINEPANLKTFNRANIAVVSFSAVDYLYAKSVAAALESFGVKVTQTNQMLKEELEGYDAVFLITANFSDRRIESIRKLLGHEMKIISVLTKTRSMLSASNVKNILQTIEFPMLPNKIENVLHHIYYNRPLAKYKEQTSLQSSRKLKILLAEDNPINLELLQTILTLEHYEVTAVVNGELAVAAYMKEHFDLVLTDIDMPVMDGIVATRLIREIDKKEKRGKIPVIALTAYALEGDRERIIAAGLDAHIPKPVDKRYLFEVIRHFIQKKVLHA